ncbi:hypothetical protein HZS_3701 [Henneguya salminicola]|nr:hypothetical protein HZS_3701 [Henneguya salminicola]
MDSDLSHNKLKDLDIVVGSRYVIGGEIKGWGLKRHLISKTANFILRVFFRYDIFDYTGSFRFKMKLTQRLYRRVSFEVKK